VKKKLKKNPGGLEKSRLIILVLRSTLYRIKKIEKNIKY
jgi:hypothetical protein